MSVRRVKSYAKRSLGSGLTRLACTTLKVSPLGIFLGVIRHRACTSKIQFSRTNALISVQTSSCMADASLSHMGVLRDELQFPGLTWLVFFI